MSRIGNKVIELPEKVEISVDAENVVTVKGPKGELKQIVDKDITINVEGNQITLTRPTEQKRHKAMHGLYRALIYNMVVGVSEGYKISLELLGIGYKATNQGNILELDLGYSHPIMFATPPEVSVTTLMEKGKNPIVTVEGLDKQLVGQVAAKIKSFRKHIPFSTPKWKRGRGVIIIGEHLRVKAGKTASK